VKLTPDLQKKAGLVSVFVLLAAGYLYYQFSDDDTAPRPAPPVTAVQPSAPASPSRSTASGAAKNVRTTSAQLDPTLKMGPMLAAEHLVYNGSGRNIFSASSVPIAIPKPVASARPKNLPPPVPIPPPGPPPPPPIDLKFFGTSTSASGKRQAFLLHGQDVFLAADGDIVQRRYRVITVSANSVVVEDMANSNRQTLPLAGR
jgi:hypothetical protein